MILRRSSFLVKQLDSDHQPSHIKYAPSRALITSLTPVSLQQDRLSLSSTMSSSSAAETSAKPKYTFGVTNSLAPTPPQGAPLQDNATSSNVGAETHSGLGVQKAPKKDSIEYIVRQQLEAQQSKRVPSKESHAALKDNILDTVIDHIRQQYEEEVRNAVYAECEATVGAWKTIVEKNLKKEMRAGVEKRMITDAREAMENVGSTERRKLQDELESERQKVKAEMRAEMVAETKAQLYQEEYGKIYDAEKKKMETHIQADLRQEAIAELKKEWAHPVRKEMRRKFAQAVAQADSDTESATTNDEDRSERGGRAPPVKLPGLRQLGLLQEGLKTHEVNAASNHRAMPAETAHHSSASRSKHWATVLTPQPSTESSQVINKRRVPPSAESLVDEELFQVDTLGDPSLKPANKRNFDELDTEDSSDADSAGLLDQRKRVKWTRPEAPSTILGRGLRQASADPATPQPNYHVPAQALGMPEIKEEGLESPAGPPVSPFTPSEDSTKEPVTTQHLDSAQEEEEDEIDPVLLAAWAARDAEEAQQSDSSDESVFGIGPDGVYGRIQPAGGPSTSGEATAAEALPEEHHQAQPEVEDVNAGHAEVSPEPISQPISPPVVQPRRSKRLRTPAPR